MLARSLAVHPPGLWEWLHAGDVTDLLDMNILIYLSKNQPPAVAGRVDAFPEDARLCMPFVTRAELLKDAERSTRNPEVLRRLEAWVRQMSALYPAGPAICEHCAEQFMRLKVAGRPTGANDPWIPCHSLAECATLETHNTRGLQRAGGPKVEDWMAAN